RTRSARPKRLYSGAPAGARPRGGDVRDGIPSDRRGEHLQGGAGRAVPDRHRRGRPRGNAYGGDPRGGRAAAQIRRLLDELPGRERRRLRSGAVVGARRPAEARRGSGGMSVARLRLAPVGETMFPPRQTPFFLSRVGEPPGSPTPPPQSHRPKIWPMRPAYDGAGAAGCRSGRTGRSRKPLALAGSWVRIPPPPPRSRPTPMRGPERGSA